MRSLLSMLPETEWVKADSTGSGKDLVKQEQRKRDLC